MVPCKATAGMTGKLIAAVHFALMGDSRNIKQEILCFIYWLATMQGITVPQYLAAGY